MKGFGGLGLDLANSKTHVVFPRLPAADGHKVEAVADVATALTTAGRQEFDLMISDLGLPDGNGIDLLRALREQGVTMPAIALSGYGQEQDLQQSREVGFAAHLTKPVNHWQLQDAIARVVGHGGPAPA